MLDKESLNEKANNEQMSRAEWDSCLAGTFGKLGIPMDPTCGAAYGILFDYCYGVRIKIPASLAPRKFRVILYDNMNCLKMFDKVIDAGEYFVSPRKYFIPYSIQIIDADTGEKIFQHVYSAKDMPVVVDIPVPTMGDSIAWFSYCEAFQKKHNCQLYVCMPDYVRVLFEKEYPNIHFIDSKQKEKLSPYAYYRLGIFPQAEDDINCPVDYRKCALHHYAAYMLGLDPVENEQVPRITIPEERTIQEPYVCIASLASGMSKEWLNPEGWMTVVEFLKKSGYRVIDIDGAVTQGSGFLWNFIPRGAEDFTGRKPLTERAELIKHADFFIGLGSGLSWLAWCCKVPVVLISGFSLPMSEFYTPYRVINMNVCHGCFSDTRYVFNSSEFDWCPKHKGSKRQFECSLAISALAVINQIKKIPAFQKHTEAMQTNKNTGEDK